MITPMMILKMFGLFLAGVGTDYAWAKWTQASNQHKPYVAANWTLAIFIFGLIYTLTIVDRQWHLIASYLLGGWIGTVIAVKKKPE